MLRITERRPPPSEEEVWEGECRNCHSKAECVRSDITNYRKGDHTTDYEPFSWEVCPVCRAGESSNGYGGLAMYPVDKDRKTKGLFAGCVMKS